MSASAPLREPKVEFERAGLELEVHGEANAGPRPLGLRRDADDRRAAARVARARGRVRAPLGEDRELEEAVERGRVADRRGHDLGDTGMPGSDMPKQVCTPFVCATQGLHAQACGRRTATGSCWPSRQTYSSRAFIQLEGDQRLGSSRKCTVSLACNIMGASRPTSHNRPGGGGAALHIEEKATGKRMQPFALSLRGPWREHRASALRTCSSGT